MTIRLRGTFLEASSCGKEPLRRASSAPLLQVRGAPSADMFQAQRIYANSLLQRAGDLARSLQGLQSDDDDEADSDGERDKAFAEGLSKITEKLLLKDDLRETILGSLAPGKAAADSVSKQVSESSTMDLVQQTSSSSRGSVNPPPGAASCPGSAGPSGPATEHSPGRRSEQRRLLAQSCDLAAVVTTMMICNLPCKIMEEQLVAALNSMDLGGRYDFLFVPKSHRPGSNLGYAFINFVDPADAERCAELFTGYRFAGIRSEKACHVQPARLQGAERNMAQFSSGHRRKIARRIR